MLRSLVLFTAKVLDYTATAAIIIMLLVVSANIGSRWLFNSPVSGALEVSILLMPIIVFGSMAWVFATVGHFAMNSIVDARRGLIKCVGIVLQVVLCGIVFVSLSVEAANLFARSLARSEFFAGPVNIPVYYSRFFIALGATVTTAVILFMMAPQAVREIRKILSKGKLDGK